MNNRNKCRILIISALLAALVSCSVFAESFTQDQIKEILSDFRSNDYGSDPAHKHTIGKIVRFIADKPRLRSFTERQMIALLESDAASFATQQFICQQLWIIGSDESVAVLGRMLLETETVEMACYALCSNPSSAVDSVLRQALDQVPNKSKVCILNVLGDRKDGGSVERFTELIGSKNAAVAQTAARALGRIGGDKAVETIQKARAAASGDLRAVLTEAYSSCAEGYVRNKESAKALEIYTRLLDDSESLLTRRGALVGALHTGDSRAVDIMIAAMQQDEPVLVATAIVNSVSLKGAAVTQKLLAELETAAPSTQVQLIEALSQRDDPLVKDAFTALAGSRDARVRIAAYDALAEIGDGSTATMLCNALEKAQTKTEADAIMASLLRLKGERSSRAILNAISDSAPSTKIQLIQLIRDRGYAPAVQQLFELCRSNDASVAGAALRAVGALASYPSMPQLLDLLVDLPGRTVQAQAFRAVTTVIGRSDRRREDISRLIQGRLDSTTTTPARCSLLRLLSAVPDDMSLQSLKTASEDSDPSVQDAAIRTLAGYPDPAAIDVLLKVFQISGNRAHRAAALRGCVRLLKADGIPPQRAVRSYQQLVAHTSTAAEKKLILSGLAAVQHPAALGIAQDLMGDDAVKTEAALALVSIAQNTVAIDPARAAAAAKLILGDSSHHNIHPQARAVIKIIGEFVSLFDGKSFAGWEGDTTTWRIENGVITAGSLEEQAPRNEFLATTREYENFDLRLKFKITGNRRVNAGVQFRTRRIPNHHEVSGYQADIGPGVDGHLYDESRRRRMLATPDPETVKKAQAAAGDDGWQIYRIRAEGDHIQLWLNGVNTVDYMEKDTNIPRTGIIALQIHGGMQAVIAYKDIKIRELPEPQ
jgi:HEAT repeat protein